MLRKKMCYDRDDIEVTKEHGTNLRRIHFKSLERVSYLTDDPFMNCQIFTLGSAGSFIQRSNKKYFNMAIDYLCDLTNKSTMLIDIREEYFNKLKRICDHERILSFHQYTNLNTGTGMVLVRIRVSDLEDDYDDYEDEDE